MLGAKEASYCSLLVVYTLMSEWAYQAFEQHYGDNYCLAIEQKMQLNTSQYWI